MFIHHYLSHNKNAKLLDCKNYFYNSIMYTFCIRHLRFVEIQIEYRKKYGFLIIIKL